MAAARFASGSSSLSAAERRALTEMPLHAITSVHGEPALREWLAIEAEGFAATDQERVQRAPALVSRVHVADRRQREPYINHPCGWRSGSSAITGSPTRTWPARACYITSWRITPAIWRPTGGIAKLSLCSLRSSGTGSPRWSLRSPTAYAAGPGRR